MRTYLFLLSFCTLFLVSCNRNSDKKGTIEQPPSEEEQIQAVKDLLKQSINDAILKLSKKGAFLENDSLKINFPKEAQSIIENIKKIPQGNKLLENTLQQLNEAAESSIETMKPVINAAIDSMSVEEANKILLAKDAAATDYLVKVLKEPLIIACQPIVVESLDKQVVKGVTPRKSWTALAGNYNKLATSKVGKIADLNSVEENILDEFVTENILDAVFFLVAKEEMSIRKHPGTKISQAIVKHFGWME